MEMAVASIRISVVTMLICVVGYSLAVVGVAQAVPGTAAGSLLTAADGTIVGSRLISQGFAEPRYFWPRPSAVKYKAAGGGGSNKSPTSGDLSDRARGLIARYGASAADPLPVELAAASGSGLDPDISEHAALYQADRVAAARGLPRERVVELIEQRAFSPGGILTSDRLVDVLELNLALDALR